MTDKQLADAFIEKFSQIKSEAARVIVGQDKVIQELFISIFCGGHTLLVGVPGLAKTLLVQTVAKMLDMSFSRIQFTPDLMPSDILGSETLDKDRNFKYIKGPIFANVILADEINRTPPKTQSALLEAMQEHSVSIAGNYFTLDEPFFVLATQNPIEQEGTYPLPEAQLDRFMFNLHVDYPSYQEEIEVIKRTTSASQSEVSKVCTKEDIIAYQNLIKKVPVVDNVVEYAVKLVHKTRPNNEFAPKLTNEYLDWGAGPRASQYLILGAKCHALMQGKYAPDIDDVRAIATSILRHRIVKNFKAEADELDEKQIISQLL